MFILNDLSQLEPEYQILSGWRRCRQAWLIILVMEQVENNRRRWNGPALHSEVPTGRSHSPGRTENDGAQPAMTLVRALSICSGNARFNPVASLSLQSIQISHFVGSNWYQRIPLR